jgi:hypothetical protein
MNAMAEDPETLKLAEEGIRHSVIYEALRLKILAVTDHLTRQIPVIMAGTPTMAGAC